METSATLETIFQNVFGNDSISISPETDASQISEWDSLNHINLIVAVEKTFGVKFALGEIEGLKNVGHLIDLIDKKRPS